MKRYFLVESAFVAGNLLAPGSIITDDDLGKKTVTKGSKTSTVQVRPPSTAIEVDTNGQPKTEEGALAMQAVVGSAVPMQIAPVAPFAPNPTHAQGAPAQPAGGLQFAEGQLPTAPAVGVESNEAAEARAEQQEAATEVVQAVADKAGDGEPAKGSTAKAEPVNRRSGK
tara:strand:- start:836 stop:1342 length:507 start_codon:yes stop_codon:yes gene_type:complete